MNYIKYEGNSGNQTVTMTGDLNLDRMNLNWRECNGLMKWTKMSDQGSCMDYKFFNNID